MRRQLTACCLVCFAWGCAKDEPPPAPPVAPAQAEPSDEDQRPEKAAEEQEAPEAPAAGADLPKSTNGATATPQGGLKQDKRKEEPQFTDLKSAEKALIAADLELVDLLKGATALSDSDARCERACRAFASLERAAEGVCRLAGESDDKCSHARARVKVHSERLKACDCK
ncbi:MAG: hypothetical protein H6718_10010 [Polyangiaceae bacterium]|nr:hypothetical protein [Myxococcales bacterium]MCB9585724.1 hypothetical protein [Polyangiaceae bacterium]MCB9607347.1 hypothetical protein [Polyangiaceae bacterium]